MPDHVHLLIAPNDRELPVGNASGAIKRWMRQDLRASWQWQPGSFDRLLRSEESAYEKWQYIRENPVRAGLVEKSEDWPSSHWVRIVEPAVDIRLSSTSSLRQAERLPYNHRGLSLRPWTASARLLIAFCLTILPLPTFWARHRRPLLPQRPANKSALQTRADQFLALVNSSYHGALQSE